MKFTIVGIGYVGASTAALFAAKHSVSVVDISREKLDRIRRGVSPISDKDLSLFLAEERPSIAVSEDSFEDYRTSDFIVIATPTNYDPETGHLETSSIEAVVNDIENSGSPACIVIKSTIPTGLMNHIQNRFPDRIFLYVPEFLREGRAFHDQLYPDRIIVGFDKNRREAAKAAESYLAALKDCIKADNVPTMMMSFGEAEAVKLFSNTFLAMRVAFFNELDTLAEAEGYDSKTIVDGVCADPRIGNHYNNPSFGYGGYCLPKDTRQLLYDYEKIPQKLIRAIVESNTMRKSHIAAMIIKTLKEKCGEKNGTVGIYRLVMKSDSSNFRESSILSIMDLLKAEGVNVIIYEPILGDQKDFEGTEVINDSEAFKERCDLIVANRTDPFLADVEDKVYTRDIYFEN